MLCPPRLGALVPPSLWSASNVDDLAPVSFLWGHITLSADPITPAQRNHRGDHHDQKDADHNGLNGTHEQRLRRFAPAAYSENVRRRREYRFDQVSTVVAELDLPPAVFKTCPWQPRELIETGLRQWLRCCAPALQDHQVIGMPSRAVDEAWHGLILCTARYSAFCHKAYGEFLHHHPDGGAPADVAGANDSVDEQLRRTVIAWSLVATPGETCVLWDLDERVGVEEPWGLDAARVAAIQAAVTELSGDR
jgi:hypothetical protein